MTPRTCEICKIEFCNAKKLTCHIKTTHGLTVEDYTVQYIFGGQRPLCPACGETTRYVALTFKKYCLTHSHIAESEGGKRGGAFPAWNKGKTKDDDERIANLAKKLSGEGNAFFGKSHTRDTLEKISQAKRLTQAELEERVKPVNATYCGEYSQYTDQSSLLKIKCNACGTIDEVSIVNIMRCWRCRQCFPQGSRQQAEISKFVESLGVTTRVCDRKVISPLELDVFVPDKLVAIEYHGLFWHSGGLSGEYDSKLHRKKYEKCKANGVKLLQFFSDEWINHRELCESMIKISFGIATVKLNARDCRVEKIDKVVGQKFLDENHIAGATKRHRHTLGLIHKDQGLVGVMTLRVPVQQKWGRLLEVGRMAFSKDTIVRGGASKLFATAEELAIAGSFVGLLSYADLRFGSGNVYRKCGFTEVHDSKINYWYSDGVSRMDRFAFRAQNGMTENEVANTSGVRPVFGAGNLVFRKLF